MAFSDYNSITTQKGLLFSRVSGGGKKKKEKKKEGKKERKKKGGRNPVVNLDERSKLSRNVQPGLETKLLQIP